MITPSEAELFATGAVTDELEPAEGLLELVAGAGLVFAGATEGAGATAFGEFKAFGEFRAFGAGAEPGVEPHPVAINVKATTTNVYASNLRNT